MPVSASSAQERPRRGHALVPVRDKTRVFKPAPMFAERHLRFCDKNKEIKRKSLIDCHFSFRCEMSF